ncbi:SpoIID/LytB domain-containing protein, partial [Kribbella sp. NPDC051952]
LFDVGSLRTLRVLKRTGVGPSGGRALTVEATGSKGKRVLTADQVRIRLHLRSGWIAFPLGISTAAPEVLGR